MLDGSVFEREFSPIISTASPKMISDNGNTIFPMKANISKGFHPTLNMNNMNSPINRMIAPTARMIRLPVSFPEIPMSKGGA